MLNRFMIRIGALLITLSSFLPVFAQQPKNFTDEDLLYKQGMELMQKEKFAAARVAFEEYLDQQSNPSRAPEAAYYIGLSAIKLYHHDGESLIEDFVINNPDHPKALLAYYELGNFHFKEKNYDQAAEYYSRVKTEVLNSQQKQEVAFRSGYANLTEKNLEQALQSFNRIKREPGNYQYAASYYAGYIEYNKGLYSEALSDFERAANNESYENVIPYLKSNIYFRQKRYNELQQYAEQMLDKEGVKNKEEIAQLLGETYYFKGDYDNAARLLRDYAEKSNRGYDGPIVYKLAFSQLQIGQNQQAIDNFKRIAAEEDTLGQYASYYLGVLYVKEDNKNFALAAFDQARSQDYNRKIKEEAFFSHGKVLYDLERYSDAILVFQDFSQQFPNSNHNAEVNDLLSEAFLNSTNYAQAIEYIESLDYKSPKVRAVYQKVAFFRGTEFFNNGEFYSSVQMFKKSLEYPVENEFVVKAHFWSGEAYSIGRKYDEAIGSYREVVRYAPPTDIFHLKARYGLGYAFYNSKEYGQSLDHFKFYVDRLENSSNKMFYHDAMLRLADCYYAAKNYNQAIEIYDRAIRNNNPDQAYAFYQEGVIFSIQGNFAVAKNNLNTVITRFSNSRVYDDALFELAQVYFKQGNYEEAIDQFNRLINNQSNSVYVPFALQNRAISNYNLQNYSRTAADYKRILDDYSTHEIANSAVLGLQEALTLAGNPDEFDPYLKRFKESNPENTNLASIEYESAKSLYFNQSYANAINAFQEYIEEYPRHPNAFEARYFLADSYYRSGQTRQALNQFETVVEENKTAYVNRAIDRMADLNFENGKYQAAINDYQKLAKAAKNKKEQYNAWSGLMKAYFQVENYDQVSQYAGLILEKGNVNLNAQNEAYLYMGKAAYQKGNYEVAVDNFIQTLNAAKDENGAEAQFLMARILYEQEEYQQSIEALYDLNKNFGSYEEWLGKSFLLIADNYVGLNETFQAKATLKSIIDNAPPGEIKSKAEAKLKKIEEDEVKEKELEEDTTFFETETTNIDNEQ